MALSDAICRMNMSQHNRAVSTAVRYLTLLSLLQRGGSWGSAQIRQRLAEQGINVSQRTIQRDMEALQQVFPDLQRFGPKNEYTWRWKKGAAVQDIPGWNLNLAIAMHMASKHLIRLLPPAVLDDLRPYFEKSHQVLKRHFPEMLDWDRRIQCVSPTIVGDPPDIDSDVLVTVYTAVLQRQPLAIDYYNRDGEEKSATFSPLGLVILDKITYVVGCFWNYDEVRRLALHRITDAEPDPHARFNQPEDFELERFVEQNGFQYLQADSPDRLRIRLLTDRFTAFHLHEMPLSDDQNITYRSEDDRYVISATVANSQNLRWWLLSHGPKVTVLDPPELREELLCMLKQTVQAYEPFHDTITPSKSVPGVVR